eukprot:4747924-Pyramimonas_sp.AAC.1
MLRGNNGHFVLISYSQDGRARIDSRARCAPRPICAPRRRCGHIFRTVGDKAGHADRKKRRLCMEF